ARSQPGKRIPLWLQRLRAADLLQVVRQYPDFPILAETSRDCLHDVFDLGALRQVADALQKGEIRVHYVQTPLPSPMASGLMFDFLSENLYEGDRSRLPAQAAAVSSELLADILQREAIPTIVAAEVVQQAEARWQHLAPDFQARAAEELLAIIEKLAPITAEELALRSTQEPSEWLVELQRARRILEIAAPPAGWIAAMDKDLLSGGGSDKTVLERVRRFLRVRGPIAAVQIGQMLFLPADAIKTALRSLHSQKEIVRGRLVVGTDDQRWCERQNFAELYRRAVAVRREAIKPADAAQFLRFQLRWHKVNMPGQDLKELLQRYAGFRFPVSVFEREVLRSRLCAESPNQLPEKIEEFSHLIERGEFIARGHRTGEDSRLKLDFIARGSGEAFTPQTDSPATAEQLAEKDHAVYTFVKENGASFVRDISDGTGQSAAQTLHALGSLARAGLATSEDYTALLSVLSTDPKLTKAAQPEAWLPQPLPEWTQSKRPGRRRRTLSDSVRQQVQLGESRWFLTSSFAVLGKQLDRGEIATRQARLLLHRYGILVKECYRRESGLLPWYEIFQVLKRLEWQGEIRRGYFIAGLSGVQFALPEAVALLEQIQTGGEPVKNDAVLLSTADPALPLGGTPGREMQDMHGNKISMVRAPANHLVLLGDRPVMYSENYGTRVRRLAKIPQDKMDACVGVIKSLLQLPPDIRPRRKIEIEEINGQPATACKLAEVFLRNGFERDGSKLVLWPSGL
ncbi:MAG: hypothetical protein O7G31_15045, partial [Calditrichaeota bacterium]|nr:hypothetical protein [Calditrichota bacterium]